MKRKYALIILLVFSLFLISCNKVQDKENNDNDEKMIAKEDEIKNLEDNIFSLNMEKEEYRKNYEDIAEKYIALEEVTNFYKRIAGEFTGKDAIRNKFASNLLGISFGVGNNELEDGYKVSLSGLYGQPLRIGVSYNIISNKVRHEYSSYFGESLPAINLASMLDIKTSGDYEIEGESIDKTQSDKIIFKNLKAGDKVIIKMNKTLQDLTDYKSDTITINIVE